ncbi:MAG: hypothetical protein H6Q18_333 [Bacteroidetes bacterium]|nr:hypothetical protein [Bacteroidota bacterium]
MTNKSESVNSFTQLFSEVKDYVKLQGEYVKIELVEKMTKLIATLLFIIIALVLVMGLLFYLLFSLAYALAPSLGFIASFGIISGIYLVLLAVLMLFRKQLIVNPLLRMIVNLFYEKPNDGNETDNQ